MEDYPQTWVIPEGTTTIPYEDENGEELVAEVSGMMLKFEVDRNERGELVVDLQFDDDIDTSLYPFLDALFRLRIQELHHLKNIRVPETPGELNITQWEWDAIWNFHDKYATSLRLATFELHQEILKMDFPNDQRTDSFFRDVETWSDHYTDFHVELDHVAYNAATCDSSEMVDFFSYQQYELEKSNYQEMLWQYRSDDDDMCLHLDNMLQIVSDKLYLKFLDIAARCRIWPTHTVS